MPTFIDASEADQRQRLLGVALFVVVVFTFFGARLLQLQVIKYEELSQDAKDNYTVDHVIVADRGTIFDRHGRVLASNRPTFDVYLTPRHIHESKLLAERLSSILQFDTLDRLELVDSWTGVRTEYLPLGGCELFCREQPLLEQRYCTIQL